MKSRASLSLPALVVDGNGLDPLRCVVAACEDALAAQPERVRSEIQHVMLAGGSGSGRDIAALLPRRLGLPAPVTCTLASGESGAAGLAILRMAEACCRASAAARVLVAAVGASERLEQRLPPAAAALVSGSAMDGGAGALTIERLATWNHGPHSGEMTLSEGSSGFDLEASSYLDAGGQLDVAGFLRDHLGLGLLPEAVTSAAWAIHAGGASANPAPRDLEDVGRALGLGDAQLKASRAALSSHGTRATTAVWQALRSVMEDDAAQVIAMGLGPATTLEAAWLQRAL